MNEKITEIVFIIDRSGSMSGFEADTVGGFNSTLKQQREDTHEGSAAYVTTVLFSNGSETVHDRLPIEKVGEMKLSDYRVGGCTALMDAVGDTVKHIRDIHRYARPEDVPGHTIFIITTDGYENASRRYDAKSIKSLIKTMTDEYGWKFIFLAANIDAAEAAGNIGIEREMAVNFDMTSAGCAKSYRAMSKAIKASRRGIDICECAEWREELDADNAGKKTGKTSRGGSGGSRK